MVVKCKCGAEFRVPDTWAGRAGKCTRCGAALQVGKRPAIKNEAQAADDSPNLTVPISAAELAEVNAEETPAAAAKVEDTAATVSNAPLDSTDATTTPRRRIVGPIAVVAAMLLCVIGLLLLVALGVNEAFLSLGSEKHARIAPVTPTSTWSTTTTTEADPYATEPDDESMGDMAEVAPPPAVATTTTLPAPLLPPPAPEPPPVVTELTPKPAPEPQPVVTAPLPTPTPTTKETTGAAPPKLASTQPVPMLLIEAEDCRRIGAGGIQPVVVKMDGASKGTCVQIHRGCRLATRITAQETHPLYVYARCPPSQGYRWFTVQFGGAVSSPVCVRKADGEGWRWARIGPFDRVTANGTYDLVIAPTTAYSAFVDQIAITSSGDWQPAGEAVQVSAPEEPAEPFATIKDTHFTTAKVGVKLLSDRNYSYLTLPQEMDGALLLYRSSEECRDWLEPGKVNANRPGWVYVAALASQTVRKTRLVTDVTDTQFDAFKRAGWVDVAGDFRTTTVNGETFNWRVMKRRIERGKVNVSNVGNIRGAFVVFMFGE